ncbi:MAG: hypothetical protein LBG49_02120 [Mycoplasmataceae bacterium]|jgi:hypothetical protein|nr:hypothetical protein [Mycoplasmataceae bacterium]
MKDKDSYQEKFSKAMYEEYNRAKKYQSRLYGFALILAGLILPPIIGLAWAIPVLIHRKKKLKK